MAVIPDAGMQEEFEPLSWVDVEATAPHLDEFASVVRIRVAVPFGRRRDL